MTPQINRIRALADAAERQYNEEVFGGGEPVYPEWIDDARWVARCAELAYMTQTGSAASRADATFGLCRFLVGVEP